MLAFFVPILGLVTGAIVIGIALLTRHPKRAGKIGLILLGWIGLYAVVLLVASFTSRPRYLGFNQERCFDFINTSSGWGVPTNLPGLVAPLWIQKIQLGETVSQTVAFDLPVDTLAGQPGLVVTEGIGPLSAVIIGDENSFFHAKTEFLLNP